MSWCHSEEGSSARLLMANLRVWQSFVLALTLLRGTKAGCGHEQYGIDFPDGAASTTNGANYTTLRDGIPVVTGIRLNMTQQYFYENFNVTTMDQPDRHRKLIVSLEPCEGVVYLLVRKTRRCWPNPNSCCHPLPGATLQGVPLLGPSPPPCDLEHHAVHCDWTHFHSVVDGTKDASPSFFEVPLSSAKYFISVYAPLDVNLKNGVLRPKFQLMVLADIGAYPRPGLQGRVRAKQADEMSVELSWDQASFMPLGVSALKYYYVYSSLLLPHEIHDSAPVLLNPSKIMNTVCGLERNAVKYSGPLTDANCIDGVCKTIISGVVPKKRYMLNIVAQSQRLHNSSYSGIIVSTDWSESTTLLSDNVTSLIGAICGTVFGVVVIGYLWIVKLYN